MTKRNPMRREGLGLALLILAQSFVAVFFLSDVVIDWAFPGETPAGQEYGEMMLLETVASLTLVASVVFELRYLVRLLREQDHLRRGMKVASGALQQVIDGHFRDWALTPAERDVASFAIKGSSIAEIAELRDTAQGTVKAHLNNIYRKADVSGRNELVSLLIEDLMHDPLLQDEAERTAADATPEAGNPQPKAYIKPQ